MSEPPPHAAGATVAGTVRAAARPLSFALQGMRGTCLGPAPGASWRFAGAAADSRRVRRGELFFALPGQRADGFDFAARAVAAGAAAVVVDARRGRPPDLPACAADGAAVAVIGVADPLAALADLARAVRATFTGRVVGITGSNGKTTTKELTAAALSASGRVLRTQSNYNTEIGLPLTILSAAGDEKFWVLEMAMRGPGQIAALADIARPDVGVITNVAGAHLELLGSIEAIARAKGELFAALGPHGIAVLPGGDPLVEAEAARLPASRKVRFDGGAEHAGRDVSPDVTILDSIDVGPAGQIVRYAVRFQPVVARLPLGGAHNARNGAAALAVAAALNLDAPDSARALADTVLPPHRSSPRLVSGRVVLDDCYNANPASMRAALAAVVASVARAGGDSNDTGGAGDGKPPSGNRARAFAILGDMLELGPDAAALHRELGHEAGARLAGLVGVGPLGAEIVAGAREVGLVATRVATTNDPVAAAALVAPWTSPGDWILIKASRGMRLERAVEALVAHPPTP